MHGHQHGQGEDDHQQYHEEEGEQTEQGQQQDGAQQPQLRLTELEALRPDLELGIARMLVGEGEAQKCCVGHKAGEKRGHKGGDLGEAVAGHVARDVEQHDKAEHSGYARRGAAGESDSRAHAV